MRALFKDLDRINNKSKQEENLNEIYQAMNNEKELKEFLMRGNEPEKKEHIENHSRCSYKKENKIIAHTEKRMCRCMFYCNNQKTKEKCSTCSYDQKWVNFSEEYEIIDYEVPPKFVCKGIGGVDLVIKYQEKIYSVEMKPEDSKETIVRMIAEALTYNLDEKFKENNIPSIGYFEKSDQEKQFKELCYDGSTLEKILKEKKIAVFEFSIHPDETQPTKRFFRIKKII